MKNWETYLNKIWNGGKLFIIGVVVLFITFTLGTFKPNKNLVKKIEAVQEQKTISVLKKFGLHSPNFKYKNTKELEAVTHSLKGQLTGSIFAQPSDYGLITPLIQIMKSKVGRFLFNDVPTGVEVSDAMTHGGPFPAASDSRFSAVGHGAIYRWVRPITYQNWPKELLAKLMN